MVICKRAPKKDLSQFFLLIVFCRQKKNTMSRTGEMPVRAEWRPFDLKRRTAEISQDVANFAHKLESATQNSRPTKRRRTGDGASNSASEPIPVKRVVEFMRSVVGKLDNLSNDTMSCLEEFVVEVRDAGRPQLRTTPLEFESVSSCDQRNQRTAACASSSDAPENDEDEDEQRPAKKRRKRKTAAKST